MIRERNATQHHSFEMRRHTLQPETSSAAAAAAASQGRRKSAPMTSGGGGDRRRRSSPHHYEERHQRRHQPTVVPLPPPQLSIAEQFMSSSSPSASHNDTRSTDPTQVATTKKREEPAPPRLSIAEQFMSQKQRSTSQPQETEKQASDANNEITVENLASSIVRSTSAFSRLIASFHVGSSKVSDSRLSLESESVSTPSTSDVRPVAKSDHHRRHPQHHQQQQQQQQQQRSVRPYQQKHQHQCHCQCSNNLYNSTAKFLDIEKSITQEVQEQDDKVINACRRKRKRRTICVITTFAILMAGAITAFLTWPRTPLFRIDGASLLQPPKITETHYINAGNVAFESAWAVTATIDNRQNFIPLHFSMETVVKDSGTIIGRHLQQQQQQQQQQRQQVFLPARSISQVDIPVFIDYEARQASDPIFSSLRRACVENTHEALQLQFWITIHIAGLEWTGYNPSIVATPATGGLLCPTG